MKGPLLLPAVVESRKKAFLVDISQQSRMELRRIKDTSPEDPALLDHPAATVTDMAVLLLAWAAAAANLALMVCAPTNTACIHSDTFSFISEPGRCLAHHANPKHG